MTIQFKEMLTLNRIRGMINRDPTLSKLSDRDRKDVLEFLRDQQIEIELMIAITRRAKYSFVEELARNMREENDTETRTSG